MNVSSSWGRIHSGDHDDGRAGPVFVHWFGAGHHIWSLRRNWMGSWTACLKERLVGSPTSRSFVCCWRLFQQVDGFVCQSEHIHVLTVDGGHVVDRDHVRHAHLQLQGARR